MLSEIYDLGESPEGVKIVYHKPNGIRTIGVRDIHNNHVLFFDRAKYRKK